MCALPPPHCKQSGRGYGAPCGIAPQRIPYQRSLSLRLWVFHPMTRAHAKLLGPCFKTGRIGGRLSHRDTIPAHCSNTTSTLREQVARDRSRSSQPGHKQRTKAEIVSLANRTSDRPSRAQVSTGVALCTRLFRRQRDSRRIPAANAVVEPAGTHYRSLIEDDSHRSAGPTA